MSWIELFLSYARDGLEQPIDLEYILPHAGDNRVQIMAEVDAVAQYHYKLKVAHEEKVRRRFNKGAGTTDDEAALLGNIMESLSISGAAMEEAVEMADEESEEEEEDDDEEYSERESIRSVNPNDGEKSDEPRNKYAPMPTPDHLDPDLPPLGTTPTPTSGKKKDRRSSSGSKERSSMEKLKGGFSRHSPDPTKGREKEDKRPPPIRVPPAGPAGDLTPKKSAARKARERAAKLNLQPPETPAINELRPLFVEVVSGVRARRPSGANEAVATNVTCKAPSQVASKVALESGMGYML